MSNELSAKQRRANLVNALLPTDEEILAMSDAEVDQALIEEGIEPTKGIDKMKAMLAQMDAKSGRVRCEKCSTPNWEVTHLPGNCPTEHPP